MSEQRYSTYLTDRVGPMPFCPGCGHSVLLKALDKALVKLQLDPTNIVVVTDIGCIGMADRYFDTHAFHGLHGRSITYACGLKLARPELHVIAIKGDGGCGIGGTHLLNVARRNIGITLLVANNFNYGMTGGQHSVTTFTGGLTSTTPWGNVEAPMDLCRTAAAAGASWVYRGTSFDKDLADVMARAIEYPGFAMLDVLELCTAYYSPRNKIKRPEMLALAGRHDMTLGQIVDSPRPEYSVSYRQAWEAGKEVVRPKPAIDVEFEHHVDRQKGIVLAGSAGQKIKSTATLFAQGAMYSGLEVTQKDDYPITVMTGHSLAEVIVSPRAIEYTAIEVPDYVLVLSEDGLKKTRQRIAALPESSTLFIEETLEVPATGARVLRLPFISTARQVNKLSLAVVGMAALLAEAGMFSSAAFSRAIEAFQKPAIAETNIKAVKAGSTLNGVSS